MAKTPYQIFRFKNGFKLILYPKKGLYSVAFNLHLYAGHIFEDEKTIGLSHFAEHMIFKGTDAHPTPQILNKFQDEIAFHPTAYTSSDHVVVYGISPKANLDESLKHLIRLTQNSIFKNEDIEKERSVISEEFLRRMDNPDVYLWDVGMQRRFRGPTSVVCRSTLETVKNVQQVRSYLIKDFYHQYFVPARAVLGIAGDIKKDQILEVLRQYFSKSKASDSKYFPALSMKDASKLSIKHFEGDFNKVYLLISWPIFVNLSDLKISLTFGLLQSILGRRIWEVLREDLGVVYDFSLGSFAILDEIYLATISTSFEKSKFDLVVKVLDAEIRKIIKEGISSIELNQHIKRMDQTSPMSFDYPTSALAWMTSDLYIHNKIFLPDECIKVRSTINSKDVHKLARSIFKKNFIHISAIGPTSQKELETLCQPLVK